jgi:hypothetical protein
MRMLVVSECYHNYKNGVKRNQAERDGCLFCGGGSESIERVQG